MKMEKFYKDKVVLITGASMGIGKEMARQVLSFGGTVIITRRSKQKLECVQKELGSGSNTLLIHQGDVADYENNVVLIEKIKEKFGRLDVVICNAGLSCFGEVGSMKA